MLVTEIVLSKNYSHYDWWLVVGRYFPSVYALMQQHSHALHCVCKQVKKGMENVLVIDNALSPFARALISRSPYLYRKASRHTLTGQVIQPYAIQWVAECEKG